MRMEDLEKSNIHLCVSIVKNNWERRTFMGTTEDGIRVYAIDFGDGDFTFTFSLPGDLDEESFFAKIKRLRKLDSMMEIARNKIKKAENELERLAPLVVAAHQSALARIQRQKVELMKLRDQKLQEVKELNSEIKRLNRVLANSGCDSVKAEKAGIFSEMRNFYETRGATLRLRGEALPLSTIFYGLEEAVGNDPYKEKLSNEHGKLDAKTRKLVRKYFTSADDLRKGYANWRKSN